MMLYTTLNKIRKHSPCTSGWEKLLKTLGKPQADDEPLPFLTILNSNGLDDALWCLRTTPEYDRESRLFAVWCASQVKHLMTDPRSLNALVVAENFANGLATDAELDAARYAAWGASDAAWAVARYAAWDAAWYAARDARYAAWAAARDAAWDAAWAASDAAGGAKKEVFAWIITGEFAKWEKEGL